MSKKPVHVVRRDSGWAVKTAGASKAAKITPTQREAIDKGIQMARNQRTDLIVHREDGRIRSRDSYGKDPLSPKGREH